MGKQTPLFQKHLTAGAKMVNFAGWDMPIHYGSQLQEHNHVRQHAGVFDVSHMTVIDLTGSGSKAFLQVLLTNDVEKLTVIGRALYSAMLNTQGGVIDDLIVYRLNDGYRLVVNCATREKDLQWIEGLASDFKVKITERSDLAILAVHGPRSIDIVCDILPPAMVVPVRELPNFTGVELPGDWFIARTGYTGERGVELIIPGEDAPELWDLLLDAGVIPVGLGARDTLRLEAGMNLYGHDMDETTTPLEANMEQTVSWQPESRQFIGREALSKIKQQDLSNAAILTGLVLEGRGILREGQTVETDKGDGVITSGTFSPTLKHSIALARIPAGSSSCLVDIRGTLTPVRIVKPNFVRFGKKVYDQDAG